MLLLTQLSISKRDIVERTHTIFDELQARSAAQFTCLHEVRKDMETIEGYADRAMIHGLNQLSSLHGVSIYPPNEVAYC